MAQWQKLFQDWQVSRLGRGCYLHHGFAHFRYAQAKQKTFKANPPAKKEKKDTDEPERKALDFEHVEWLADVLAQVLDIFSIEDLMRLLHVGMT